MEVFNKDFLDAVDIRVRNIFSKRGERPGPEEIYPLIGTIGTIKR